MEVVAVELALAVEVQAVEVWPWRSGPWRSMPLSSTELHGFRTLVSNFTNFHSGTIILCLLRILQY